ncbi:DUF3558 family protein [Nocardia sp. NPDC058519]|uniref:DUF3558 family protein n=1 Tax=Nocardia sp. NPDC058519 TaxID=3346535 RepID=UPI00365EFBDE
MSFDADPVPAGDVMPVAGPLLRTVTIELSRGPVLLPQIHITRPPMASNAVEREHFSAPRRLDGIGDDAMIRDQDQAGAMRSWATAVLGNVSLEVVTSGMDWSGGATPPVWRSLTMRDDLSSGAEAILADLARELPESLPVATSEPPSTSTAPPSVTTTAVPVPVWNPCGIPESAIAAAGLDPSKKENGTGGRCRWHGDGYTVEILAGAEPFHEVYYSHYGWYPTPRPIKIRDRPALMVAKAFGGAGADVDDGYCELGFDTPFGTKNGIPTGRVSIELWDTVDREPAAVCKDLARLAEPLVAHIPPSR